MIKHLKNCNIGLKYYNIDYKKMAMNDINL